MNEKIIPIRCPNERKHHKYDLCGNFLGALYKDKIFLLCDCCKQMFEITAEDNILHMKPINKDVRLKFKDILRMIE